MALAWWAWACGDIIRWSKCLYRRMWAQAEGRRRLFCKQRDTSFSRASFQNRMAALHGLWPPRDSNSWWYRLEYLCITNPFSWESAIHKANSFHSMAKRHSVFCGKSMEQRSARKSRLCTNCTVFTQSDHKSAPSQHWFRNKTSLHVQDASSN